MLNGVADVLKPFEHFNNCRTHPCSHQAAKVNMAIKIKFGKSVCSFVGTMLEPFEWPPHNFVFASNICPTSVQLLLNKCLSNVETV